MRSCAEGRFPPAKDKGQVVSPCLHLHQAVGGHRKPAGGLAESGPAGGGGPIAWLSAVKVAGDLALVVNTVLVDPVLGF